MTGAILLLTLALGLLYLGVVGETVAADGTTPSSGRQGKTGESIVALVNGSDYETASRGRYFAAGDQGAGVTVQTSITTTAPLSLHNPAASQRRLAIQFVTVSYFSGTLTAGSFYHGFNPVGTTLPSSGTTLTSYCTDIGVTATAVASAVGVAKTGSTVVAATVLYPFASVFPVLASSAVSGPVACFEKVQGRIILEPGAAYQLCGAFGGAGSSPKVSVGIGWVEMPIV